MTSVVAAHHQVNPLGHFIEHLAHALSEPPWYGFALPVMHHLAVLYLALGRERDMHVDASRKREPRP